MDTGEISIFVIFFGLLAVIIVFTFFKNRARCIAWEELASQVGLISKPGNYWGNYPTVSGVYHGRPLLLQGERI